MGNVTPMTLTKGDYSHWISEVTAEKWREERRIGEQVVRGKSTWDLLLYTKTDEETDPEFRLSILRQSPNRSKWSGEDQYTYYDVGSGHEETLLQTFEVFGVKHVSVETANSMANEAQWDSDIIDLIAQNDPLVSAKGWTAWCRVKDAEYKLEHFCAHSWSDVSDLRYVTVHAENMSHPIFTEAQSHIIAKMLEKAEKDGSYAKTIAERINSQTSYGVTAAENQVLEALLADILPYAEKHENHLADLDRMRAGIILASPDFERLGTIGAELRMGSITTEEADDLLSKAQRAIRNARYAI